MVKGRCRRHVQQMKGEGKGKGKRREREGKTEKRKIKGDVYLRTKVESILRSKKYWKSTHGRTSGFRGGRKKEIF